MNFTDDDLQMVRDNLSRKIHQVTFNVLAIKSLINRLEAAEAYAKFRLRFPAGHDGEKDLLDVWRKASGK